MRFTSSNPAPTDPLRGRVAADATAPAASGASYGSGMLAHDLIARLNRLSCASLKHVWPERAGFEPILPPTAVATPAPEPPRRQINERRHSTGD